MYHYINQHTGKTVFIYQTATPGQMEAVIYQMRPHSGLVTPYDNIKLGQHWLS